MTEDHQLIKIKTHKQFDLSTGNRSNSALFTDTFFQPFSELFKEIPLFLDIGLDHDWYFSKLETQVCLSLLHDFNCLIQKLYFLVFFLCTQ
jgi:hypothetical protein